MRYKILADRDLPVADLKVAICFAQENGIPETKTITQHRLSPTSHTLAPRKEGTVGGSAPHFVASPSATNSLMSTTTR